MPDLPDGYVKIGAFRVPVQCFWMAPVLRRAARLASWPAHRRFVLGYPEPESIATTLRVIRVPLRSFGLARCSGGICRLLGFGYPFVEAE